MIKAVNPLDYLAPKYWPTWLTLGVMRLVTFLPLPGIVFCGSLLGKLAHALIPSRRRVVDINLRFAFPDASDDEIVRLRKRCFENIAIGAFEQTLNWWHNDRLLKMCEIEGEKYLQPPEGKGLILLTAHFTSLAVAGPTLMLHLPIPLQVMYKQAHNKLFDAFLYYHRKQEYAEVVEYSKPVTMIRGLKKGNAAWYAPDQDFRGKDTIYAPFFGVPAATLTALARFSKMTGASVVPYYIKRKENNRGYKIVVYPPLKNFPAGDDYEDALTLNQTLEHLILQNPEQYLWAHKRYKNRPEGSAPIYPKK